MKTPLIIASVLFILSGCLKNDGNVASCRNVSLAQDSITISNYMTANSLTGYSKDAATGVYYKVITPGAPPAVTTNSRVLIKYRGNLLDANTTVFDSQLDTARGPYSASGFVPGFQVLLSKIAKGGKIDGLIPSNYAYGCQGVGIIPANSCLQFYVELVDVQ